jgi:hypothetical protein
VLFTYSQTLACNNISNTAAAVSTPVFGVIFPKLLETCPKLTEEEAIEIDHPLTLKTHK